MRANPMRGPFDTVEWLVVATRYVNQFPSFILMLYVLLFKSFPFVGGPSWKVDTGVAGPVILASMKRGRNAGLFWHLKCSVV
jgi:hypothetical protein